MHIGQVGTARSSHENAVNQTLASRRTAGGGMWPDACRGQCIDPEAIG